MKLDSSTGSTPHSASSGQALTTSPFTINKVLLTDEESNEAQWEAYKNQPVGEAVTYEVGEKAIAKAQARKLVEWLDKFVSEGCDDRVGGLHEPDCQCGFGIYIGYKTWQALKKALEV